MFQVTNHAGVEWLKRHLSPEYNVHKLNCDDAYAFHIDATFMPIRKYTCQSVSSHATLEVHMPIRKHTCRSVSTHATFMPHSCLIHATFMPLRKHTCHIDNCNLWTGFLLEPYRPRLLAEPSHPYLQHAHYLSVSGPGLFLANPDRPCQQAEMLTKAGWDIIEAPRPSKVEGKKHSWWWLVYVYHVCILSHLGELQAMSFINSFIILFFAVCSLLSRI